MVIDSPTDFHSIVILGRVDILVWHWLYIVLYREEDSTLVLTDCVDVGLSVPFTRPAFLPKVCNEIRYLGEYLIG